MHVEGTKTKYFRVNHKKPTFAIRNSQKHSQKQLQQPQLFAATVSSQYKQVTYSSVRGVTDVNGWGKESPWKMTLMTVFYENTSKQQQMETYNNHAPNRNEQFGCS